MRQFNRWVARLSVSMLGPDRSQCGEGGVVGFGEGVEVLLGGDDAAVPEALLHRLEVGTAGEQPGGVGVAEVVGTDADAEAVGVEGRLPDLDAEPRSGDVPVGGQGAAAAGPRCRMGILAGSPPLRPVVA
jgi:hypothetical protein